MRSLHHRVEDVLEPGELRHRFLARSSHHFVRSSLHHQASAIENQHPLAESKHLVPAVCDVEDGNAVGLIPHPQVIEDA